MPVSPVNDEEPEHRDEARRAIAPQRVLWVNRAGRAKFLCSYQTVSASRASRFLFWHNQSGLLVKDLVCRL